MADVRGGKPVKLLIKGEAVLPAVDIKETQLDFGEVYTGVTSRIPITIINTTPVLAGQPLTTPSSPPPPRLVAHLVLHQHALPGCMPPFPSFAAHCRRGGGTKSYAPCEHQDLRGHSCCMRGGVPVYRHVSGPALTTQLQFGPAQGELVA